MHLHHLAALFALNIAAPVEFAAASVHHLHLLRVEAAPAAHELAAVDGFRGLVAEAAHRSQHARRPRVVLAEVGTRVQVDQVLVRVRFELRVARHQNSGGAHLALLHLGGAVKLLLDHVANLAERRHGFPAGLHLARAGNTVALAVYSHVVQNRLRKRRLWLFIRLEKIKVRQI